MKSKQKSSMQVEEKRRYRNKVLFVWGIPVACGVLSFLYWFLFVPLLWSALPHAEWPILWFSIYGAVAFLVWLAIMAAGFFLWRHKKLTIVKCENCGSPLDRVSYEASNDSGYKESSPHFPTKPSAVQPVADTPPSLCRNNTSSSSVCIQVQPQGTPSLYNARTGRESFDTGYHIDESDPTTLAMSTFPRENSGIIVFKKMDSIKLGENNKKKRISSSGSEGGIDFKNLPRDEGDGLEDSTKPSVYDDNMVKSNHFQAQASVEKRPMGEDKDRPPSLSRDESFKGLPEMNAFGNYLQLVTIDTPMSPRDAFFSELLYKQEENDTILRGAGDRRSYCIGDISSAEERIDNSRKSMPVLLYSSEDIESGHVQDANDEEEPDPPSKDVAPTSVDIVNERPETLSVPISELWKLDENEEHIYLVLKRDSEPDTNSPATTPDAAVVAKPKDGSTSSKEEFFIANVQRTESITSEVYLNVDGEGLPARAYKIGKWESKGNGSLSEVPIEEESPENDEGKWVVLKDLYTHIDAFIRYESEAMARERTEGKFADDDDSVFE